MNILEFSLLVWVGSFTAGLVGALTGLGGGVIIVPLLTSVFGVDIRYAVGASLVSVIATSLGSSSTYIKQGYTNLKLGIFFRSSHNNRSNYWSFNSNKNFSESPCNYISCYSPLLCLSFPTTERRRDRK